MTDATVPLIVAASSLPAFVVAGLLRRDRPRLARLMVMVGVAIAGGALGLAWAGDDPARVLAVVVAMALAVNGLGVMILVDALRRRGDGR
jgi:uncharacterized membrane protein YccC